MYTRRDERSVEKICYEEKHVEVVLDEIKRNFNKYFQRFIETNAGNSITAESFANLQKHFGVNSQKRKSAKNATESYKNIIRSSIEEFENDRQSYLDIFDEESLEEYEEDSSTFKSIVLRNKCPIIRKTLANRRAKELDKYRHDFSVTSADTLLDVVRRLCEFSEEYNSNYNAIKYETYSSYSDLKLSVLDTDEYTAYGVIGGGIKTMMLYKVNPKLFPSRSRNALWALWYLTDKKDFGCRMDSEFLMIDDKKFITQQNYFYPYELFAFYAYEIYKLLRDKATEMKAYIDPDYRYVIVDAFLNYVATEHESEINFLISQIKDDRGYSYV